MNIEQGGTVERLKGKVESINVSHESGIMLWINGDSLSYVSLTEAIALRDELNEAIRKAAGLASNEQ